MRSRVMDFTLGTTIITVYLTCMMNTDATDTRENLVVFHSILNLRRDSQSSSTEFANISMDIRNGMYPNISPITEPIKVGEPITILIYSGDRPNPKISVNECWAYNEEHYDNSTINLQLTNKTSDFQKIILTSQPMKEYDLQGHNATMLLYKVLKSFKLAGEEDVHVACSVEYCYGSCSETTTQRIFSAKLNSNEPAKDQSPSSTRDTVKSLFNKLQPPSFTVTNPAVNNCRPNSKHSLCVLTPPSISPPNCYPGSQDLQCNFNSAPQLNSSYLQHCQPGSKEPECNITATTCYPGSQNPHCTINQLNPSNSPPNCYPSSQDPRCNKTINCNPGFQNPQCQFIIPQCYPGSQHPHCRINLAPPICYPGSQNILCKSVNQTYSGFPSVYNFSNYDPRSVSSNTDVKYRIPGSKLLYSIFNSTATKIWALHKEPKQHRLYLAPTFQYVRRKRSNSSHSTNLKEKFDFKLTSSPNNFSSSSHSIDLGIIFSKSTTQTTSTVKCFPNMFKRRCIEETWTGKRPLYNPLLPPNCYPNSKDPRCIKIISVTYDPSKPPNCYPGSKDPRCGKL